MFSPALLQIRKDEVEQLFDLFQKAVVLFSWRDPYNGFQKDEQSRNEPLPVCSYELYHGYRFIRGSV